MKLIFACTSMRTWFRAFDEVRAPPQPGRRERSFHQNVDMPILPAAGCVPAKKSIWAKSVMSVRAGSHYWRPWIGWKPTCQMG